MIKPTDINLWAEIKLLKLLQKTGIEPGKLTSLQRLIHTIMMSNEMRESKGLTNARLNSITNILVYELAVKDVPTLLTGALYQVFEQDIFTALAIADLFGDNICFTVDILTAQKARKLSDKEYYESVVDRFNRASFAKERRLMTIVAILIFVQRTHLLLTSKSTTKDKQIALYTSTVDDFSLNFIRKIDTAKIIDDLAAHFFDAQTLLVNVLIRTKQRITPVSSLQACNEDILHYFCPSSTSQSHLSPLSRS